MNKFQWLIVIILLIIGMNEAWAIDSIKDINGCEVSFLRLHDSGYELCWKLKKDDYLNRVINSYDEIKQIKWEGACKDGMAHGAGSLIVNVKKNGWSKERDNELFTFDGSMYKGFFRGTVAGGYFAGNSNKINNYLYDGQNFGQNLDEYNNHVQKKIKENEQNLAKLAKVIEDYDVANLQQELRSKPEVSCMVFDEDISGSYRGGCKDGKANGFGLARGQDTYVGEFLDGKPHGSGSYYWTDPAVFYKGGWLAGKKNGKGIFVWANGNRYEGDFFEDSKTGKGIFSWEGGDRYEGDFKNNVMHGKGKLTWGTGDTYEGMFANGSRAGKGILYLANGDRYEGDFVANKREGKGVFIWANGSRYEGNYVDDKRVSSEIDTYLDIEEQFVQEWVVKNLVHEKELPHGKWYPTANGQFFMSDIVRDGYNIINQTWSGSQRNGYANGPGTLQFKTTDFLTLNIHCYMHNGSILGKATFEDATNRNSVKTKTVYIGNNKVMEEHDYKDLIYASYKIGLAKKKAKDYRFSITRDFKHGPIGTRYITKNTNKAYSTDTKMNVVNMSDTKTISYQETEGIVDKNDIGYTAVIGITNKTKEYFVVKTLISGTFVTSEYFKQLYFQYAGNESDPPDKNMKYVTISKDYLLRPEERMMDQIVVGEEEPADFQIGFSELIRVEEDWVSGLDKALKISTINCSNSKEVISYADKYLSDSKASAWHEKLKEKKLKAIKFIDQINMDLLRKQVETSVSIMDINTIDKDNNVEITVKNGSNYHLKIIIMDPMQQQRIIKLKPESTEKLVTNVLNINPNGIKVKVEDIRLIDENGIEKDFAFCIDNKHQYGQLLQNNSTKIY